MCCRSFRGQTVVHVADETLAGGRESYHPVDASQHFLAERPRVEHSAFGLFRGAA